MNVENHFNLQSEIFDLFYCLDIGYELKSMFPTLEKLLLIPHMFWKSA